MRFAGINRAKNLVFHVVWREAVNGAEQEKRVATFDLSWRVKKDVICSLTTVS